MSHLPGQESHGEQAVEEEPVAYTKCHCRARPEDTPSAATTTALVNMAFPACTCIRYYLRTRHHHSSSPVVGEFAWTNDERPACASTALAHKARLATRMNVQSSLAVGCPLCTRVPYPFR